MKEVVYHGSDKIVKTPMYGVGKSDNDHGSGFYTTKDIEKAREWALANGTDKAFCNKYEIDMSGLLVLDLDDHGTLAWIAEVIYNRGAYSNIAEEVKKPSVGSSFGNSDVQARREVFNFINKRETAIQIEGFVPTGITAREAINNNFKYNKEYSY